MFQRIAPPFTVIETLNMRIVDAQLKRHAREM